MLPPPPVAASNSLKKSATISIIDCINADFGLELSFFSVADNALNDSKDFKNVLRALLGRRTGLSELDLSKVRNCEERSDELGIRQSRSKLSCAISFSVNTDAPIAAT